jgi:hypothetical protein
MRSVFLAWCAKPFVELCRVVIDPSLEEAALIRRAAERLSVPVVEGQTTPQANDLWVGISPEGGWGDLAGETMWARSAEACLIAPRLEAAKVMTDRELLAAYVAKDSPRSVKEYRSEELILRNGRWGSCSGCPRDKKTVYPERCERTDGLDHNIHSTRDGKFFAYTRELPKAKLLETLNS